MLRGITGRQRAQAIPTLDHFQFLPAISTITLGELGKWDLKRKLKAAANNGFYAVELHYEDLVHYCKTNTNRTDFKDLCVAATVFRKNLDDLNMQVISLQGFQLCDVSTDEARKERAAEFMNYVDIADVIKTNVINISPSVYPPGELHNLNDTASMVKAFRTFARIARQSDNRKLSITFQNACHGDQFQTWREAYEIVKEVKTNNVKFLPNTFHIAGAEWADPEEVSGKLEGADA